MALHRAHNFMDAELEADIDRFLAREDKYPEEEDLLWEEEQDRIFEEMRERRLFHEPF